MVEMVVRRVGLDQNGRALVILLDLAGERYLPILIGPFEASAIAMELRGEKFERPLTHDLFVNALRALGFSLSRVDITRLEAGVYYAVMTLTDRHSTVELDARPSDAIALALRFQARIFVAEEVLLEAREALGEDHESEDEEAEAFRRLLENVNLEPDSGGADDETHEMEGA